MYWQSLWFGAPRLVRQPRGFLFGLRIRSEIVIEAIPMATILKSAQQRAAMAAKEERARDAALAMREYVAENLAIDVKTARLRARRLAKEARDRQHNNV